MKSIFKFMIKKNINEFSKKQKVFSLKDIYTRWRLNRSLKQNNIPNQEFMNDNQKELIVKVSDFEKSKKFLKEKEKWNKLKEILSLALKSNNVNILGISEDKLIELLLTIFDSEYCKEDLKFMIEAFWFAHKEIKNVDKRNQILVYFLDFFVNQENLEWKYILSILNQISLNLSKFEKIENFLELKNKLFLKFTEFFLKKMQDKQDIDYYLIIETMNVFQKLEYKDDGFYFTLESYLTENLLPFRPHKILIVVDYFFNLENTEINSKKKIFYLKSLITLIEKNLKYCVFEEIFLLFKIYMKISRTFEEDLSKFTLILLKEIEASEGFKKKENLKQINEVCLLAKEIATKEYFLELFKQYESLIYKNLNDVDPNFFAEFLFFCFEINYMSEYCKEMFFEKAVKEIYLISLENLKKLNWANYYLKGHNLIFEKTINIIDENLNAIMEKNKEIDLQKLFPFIWILNNRLSVETIQKYEKIIALKIKSLTIKDLAIIYWSVIQKTVISKKTCFLLIERYLDLVGEINKELSQMEESDDFRIGKKISTWDLTTCLWAFSNFNFDDVTIFHELIYQSKNLVVYFLEEMNDLELIGVVKIYFYFDKFFEQFFKEERNLFDYFIKILESRVDFFSQQDLTLIVYLFSTNEILKQNYPNELEKMLKKINLE